MTLPFACRALRVNSPSPSPSPRAPLVRFHRDDRRRLRGRHFPRGRRCGDGECRREFRRRRRLPRRFRYAPVIFGVRPLPAEKIEHRSAPVQMIHAHRDDGQVAGEAIVQIDSVREQVLHGPHQVAQKSTSTTRPRCSATAFANPGGSTSASLTLSVTSALCGGDSPLEEERLVQPNGKSPPTRKKNAAITTATVDFMGKWMGNAGRGTVAKDEGVFRFS